MEPKVVSKCLLCEVLREECDRGYLSGDEEHADGLCRDGVPMGFAAASKASGGEALTAGRDVVVARCGLHEGARQSAGTFVLQECGNNRWLHVEV